MPFIRSWSVLPKRLPALPGGHVCVLCFSYEVARKQQQQRKQQRPEVRWGLVGARWAGGCRAEEGRWAPGGLSDCVWCWCEQPTTWGANTHTVVKGHSCKHTPACIHMETGAYSTYTVYINHYCAHRHTNTHSDCCIDIQRAAWRHEQSWLTVYLQSWN